MNTAHDKVEYERILPEAIEAIDANAYLFAQQELLFEICRPYHKGWVESEPACFRRRTKEDYARMFERFHGSTFDLQGFRDEAEGLECEAAALECNSSWRFSDYYNRDKARGGTGLGCLNTILREYTDAYIPELFPNLLPVPPSKTEEA